MRHEKVELTQAIIKEVITYVPETGEFFWKKSMGVRKAGSKAGNKVIRKRSNYKCVTIGILCNQVLAHRLAFLYMTGSWPPDEVDHIDGDGFNNKWNNLRKATRRENTINTLRKNKTGFSGVFKQPTANTFGAAIGFHGKKKYLGTFATAEEAHEAYSEENRRLNGDFVCSRPLAANRGAGIRQEARKKVA